MIVTINDVCRSAWEATRGESSTPYDELEDSYRTNLIACAEAVLAGAWPKEPWLAFETEVCKLADGRGPMQVGSEIPDKLEIGESSGAIKTIDDIQPLKGAKVKAVDGVIDIGRLPTKSKVVEDVVSPTPEAEAAVELKAKKQPPRPSPKKTAKKLAAKKAESKKPAAKKAAPKPAVKKAIPKKAKVIKRGHR